jgi:hypothetical protein
MLFRLNGVPEDEAQEVRVLLEEHTIDFYETHGGNWGVSMAAIWLPDDSRLAEAKSLLDDYQRERAMRMREAWRGSSEIHWLAELLGQPVRLIVYLMVIALVAYVSIMPFFNWGK